MFAALLPGVRHVRGPLAAGFVWLLVTWLAIGDELKERAEGDGALGRINDLAPTIERLGIAVVASVGAYLVGSLMIALTEMVAGAAMRHAGARVSRLLTGDPISPSARATLDDWALAKLKSAGVTELGDAAVARLAGETMNEFEFIRRKLSAVDATLFAETDRHDSEASFRTALAVPLAVLVVWPSVADSPLWTLAATLVAALLLQARTLRRRAGDSLVLALEIKTPDLDPPVIKRIVQQTAEAKAGGTGTATT